MEEQNHIDKALAFMESLEKLGNQLKAAEDHQKLLLARMLDLKKEEKTDSEEYAHRQMASYLLGANGDGERHPKKKAQQEITLPSHP